jgi:hypothetical protein
MTRRLIEHHAIGHPFLDEQKLPVALDDGGHGQVRAQGHGGSITMRAESFVMFFNLLEDDRKDNCFYRSAPSQTFFASCSA